MQDQVSALRDAGVAAAFLNSSLTATQRAQVVRDAREGRCQLLYIAPERLEAPDFLDLVQRVCLVLVAVDEAHCISQWGQDFRPSYLRIPAFIDELAARPPIGAFTATATPFVRRDIIELLRLREPLVMATGFDRSNLYFAVSRPRDKFARLLNFLRERAGSLSNAAASSDPATAPSATDAASGVGATPVVATTPSSASDAGVIRDADVTPDAAPAAPDTSVTFAAGAATAATASDASATIAVGSGVIYCSTRATVEEVCARLQESGFAATRYHAGLSEQERLTNQNDFIYDRKPLMVATNAFGMGIDKSNVNFVVHYNMPKNLESYYQEAGRAGRDGTEARCLLLYAPQDVQTARYLITHSETSVADATARAALVEKDLELLRQMTFYATTNDCLRAFILRYFGEHTAPSCNNCSNCHTAFEEVEVTVEAQKIISCVYRLAQRDRSFGKSMVADILRGSKNKRIAQMRLDTLSTYGIMDDISLHRLHLIMDHLIAAGYLAVNDGDYPVLTPTPTTRALLQENACLTIKLPKEPPKPTPEEKAARRAAGGSGRFGSDSAGGGHAVPTTAADAALFEKLRALRFSLAQEADIPAYIVFTDATLRDMTHRLPQTEAEFLEVSGVGAAKLARYGAAFLVCIAEHLGKR
jgi:superfamily II DNA helicase RecQ